MRLTQRGNLRWMCLVVGCGLFALILVLRNVREKGRVESVLAQAQTIYAVVYRTDQAVPVADILPASDASSTGRGFANSTDYFRWLISNQVVKVDFAFFAAPGIPPHLGSEPEFFLSTNNAWCVTADLAPDTDGNVPLVFTRNLVIDKLTDAKASAVQNLPPFGRRGVVVLYKNGRVAFIRSQALAESFNPSHATNAILRP